MASMSAPGSKSGFSLKIGAKLGLMSGLDITLVAGMLAGSIYGNSSVKSANNITMKRQTLAFKFAQTKASARA